MEAGMPKRLFYSASSWTGPIDQRYLKTFYRGDDPSGRAIHNDLHCEHCFLDQLQERYHISVAHHDWLLGSVPDSDFPGCRLLVIDSRRPKDWHWNAAICGRQQLLRCLTLIRIQNVLPRVQLHHQHAQDGILISCHCDHLRLVIPAFYGAVPSEAWEKDQLFEAPARPWEKIACI